MKCKGSCLQEADDGHGMWIASVETETCKRAAFDRDLKGTMEFVDRIQGDKTVTVFQELQSRRIPMRFHVLGRGYERLTIVTGVESRNGRVFILVDLPNRFETDVPEWAGERIQLEFTDKDRIPHSCRTEIDHVEGDDLWLSLPGHIDRIQRRRHFRVEPPPGTRIVFPFQGRSIDAPVLNISLSGGLVISPGIGRGGAEPLVLQVGTVLYDLLLVGAMEDEKVEVGIKSAEVIRVEKVPETKRTNFAVRFSRLNRDGQGVLDRFIYYSQRRLLRKRSLLVGT